MLVTSLTWNTTCRREHTAPLLDRMTSGTNQKPPHWDFGSFPAEGRPQLVQRQSKPQSGPCSNQVKPLQHHERQPTASNHQTGTSSTEQTSRCIHSHSQRHQLLQNEAILSFYIAHKDRRSSLKQTLSDRRGHVELTSQWVQLSSQSLRRREQPGKASARQLSMMTPSSFTKPSLADQLDLSSALTRFLRSPSRASSTSNQILCNTIDGRKMAEPLSTQQLWRHFVA